MNRYKCKLVLTHDEVRILVLSLVELKNSPFEESRYTDTVVEEIVEHTARFADRRALNILREAV